MGNICGLMFGLALVEQPAQQHGLLLAANR
jgi:hypothetical protein